jgi:aspartyl-tRNA(Asn)/glutamyl-tRNA(Gln) amidotransferase subunit B
VPLVIPEAEIDAVRRALPELPEDRRARFESEYALSGYDARLLTESRALADFYEAAATSSGQQKAVANWMLRDVLAQLKERDCEIDATQLTPAALARLVALVEGGRVTAASARPLVAVLIEHGGDPEALVRERGLEAVSDTGLLESSADEVIAAHPDVVAQIRGGDAKGLNFLMGQLMKRTEGKANPKAVREILARRLAV